MNILVLNCGSSSVKYKLFDSLAQKVMARGIADRVGQAGSLLQYIVPGREDVMVEAAFPDHRSAIEKILNFLTHPDLGVIKCTGEIGSVGHRVVHGGEVFNSPVRVDRRVLEVLEECSKLAPLHNPPNINGINVCQRLIPGAEHVAVFDTAFHQTLPDFAHTYALPYRYYKELRVRKYGFHGTSHKYVAKRAAGILNSSLEDLKIITCHLGNGSSLCAVGGGKSLDTTMGFTPLAGLMMGTRCGDIDPAIIPYLVEKEGTTLDQLMDILHRESGALGVSGISSDFRDLERACLEGEPRARLAIEMFVYGVARGIGSLVPSVGGLDVLVFTAGIGENSPDLRDRICAYLNYLGVLLDKDKNTVRGVESEISAQQSGVRVLVIPTDEEKMIALETRAVIENCGEKQE
ncbi:MAG: acetate/propionate family kinase [Desulfocucumaceae bacterium]